MNVSEYLKDLPAAYQHCRTFGHSWDEISWYTVYGRQVRGLKLRCTSCFGIRRDLYDAQMNRIGSPRYDMPLGYAKPKGVDRPTMLDKKRAVFNRARNDKQVSKDPDSALIDMFRRRIAS